MRFRKYFAAAVVAALALFVVIQFVPYGRDHTNPPVSTEPTWNNTQTRDLAVRACYDCHSNETTWPWYTNIAPISWWTQQHVDEGRGKLNFSAFDRPQKDAHEAAKSVQEGEMPPAYYTPLHPDAQLSQAEKEALISGLRATLGSEREGSAPSP